MRRSPQRGHAISATSMQSVLPLPARQAAGCHRPARRPCLMAFSTAARSAWRAALARRRALYGNPAKTPGDQPHPRLHDGEECRHFKFTPERGGLSAQPGQVRPQEGDQLPCPALLPPAPCPRRVTTVPGVLNEVWLHLRCISQSCVGQLPRRAVGFGRRCSAACRTCGKRRRICTTNQQTIGSRRRSGRR